MTFLLLNLALAFYLVGAIWAHEVDIFRNWKVLDPENFHRVQDMHWKKLPYWVFIPLGLALVGSIALIWYHPAGSPAWAIWGNLACQLLSLILTAIFWGRWQAKLSQDTAGGKSVYLAKILKTHWVRTLLINAYAIILFVWVMQMYASVTTAANNIQPILSGAAASTSVVYTNSEYGFNFILPQDWQGYSIINKTWNGYGISQPGVVATGTELLVRNPNWTTAEHYEDIPIMIFTLAQWKAYQANDFSVSAAPFPASELGVNNEYVFAIPPRWDYDFSTGYQEAEAIVSSNPLKPFSL